ncbi:MAG: hypothetical protein ABL958_09465 [Bdellovibrionia bacterium]
MDTDVQKLPIFTSARWDGSRGWIEESASREDLNALVYRYQFVLRSAGLAPGDRAVIFLASPLDTLGLKLALESVGAVAIVVEKGTKPLQLIKMLRVLRPRVLATSRSNQRWAWPLQIPLRFSIGESGFGAIDLKSKFPGVIRAPAVLRFQVPAEDQIELVWAEADAFENLNLGVRTVLPANHGEEFEPATILDQIWRHGITHLRAPAHAVEKIARYLHSRGLNLPSIRRIDLTGAAKLSPEMVRAVPFLFPRSEQAVNPNQQNTNT